MCEGYRDTSQPAYVRIVTVPDSPRRRQPASGELLGGDREIEDHHRPWIVKHRSAVTSAVVVVVLVVAVVAAFLITRNLGNVNVADPTTSVAPLTSSSSAAPTTSAPVSSSAAASTSAAPSVKISDGSVVAVLAAGRWTVSAEKNLILTVVTNSATKFPKDKGPADIKKGSVITVVGPQSGTTITATSVDIGKKKS